MMRNTNKLFNGEIDGYELTRDQLIRIRSVFNDLKDGRNVLNFQKIIDLLGHYAPDAVLKRFFFYPDQTPTDVTLDVFSRFLRFLLNGTRRDKIRALCRYYTYGQSYVSMDALKDIIEQEEWSMDKLSLSNKRDVLSCDQLIKYFSQSPEATNMSTWLLSSRLTLASSVLNLPSKSHIMSLSTGKTLRAVCFEFKRIATRDPYLISQSSFRDSLTAIFPDPFIAGKMFSLLKIHVFIGLFKFFDINNDGYIDEMEFYRGIAFLPHANEADSIRRVFQMFSSRSQAEVTFNFNDADFILRHFVPSRIRKETSCKISDIGKCTSLSKFSAWAENNPAFLHLIEFIKASMHIVFGLPLPPSESETSKIIMLWLHYVIVQQSKQGSQWFVVSSKYWPSLAAQGNKAALKLSNQMEKPDPYHPISLYKKLFTSTSTPTARASPRRTSSTDRMRSLSFAEGLNSRVLEKSVHHREPLQRLFKYKLTHREIKAEKKTSRGIYRQNQRRRRSSNVNNSVNLTFEDDGTPSANNAKSSEESQPKTKTPKVSVGMNATTQNTHIAVDKRLAERMQGWSGINTNGIGISDNGQLMPSYLVLYTLAYNASKEEVLEMHPLEIGVRWTTGSKPKVSPTIGIITDTGVPKNPHFCECPFTPAHSGTDAIAIPSGKKSSIMKRLVSSNEKPRLDPAWGEHKPSKSINSSVPMRSISMPGANWSNSNRNCIHVPPERLSEQSLRFVFSRCHTVSEVCEAISKKFGDYRNRDLTPDNYRVWFIKASKPAFASHQRPKLSQITKTGGSSSSNGTINNDEKDSGISNSNLLAKQTCLVPVDLKAIGSHQLSRFLADQDPLAQHYTELFDPYEKCSRKFEFVVECLYQFYFWPLGQCPSKELTGSFVGLKNMGNTCYFNSVIQCLQKTPHLEHLIMPYLTSQTKLANEYKKLLDQMARESLVNPRSLWHTFVQKAPTFSSFVQQDAHEFLIIFLDLLNEELKQKNSSSKVCALNPHDRRKKSIINKCITAEKAWRTFCAENDSPITDVFYGLCESRCRFEGCCHKSSSFDPFASLTLPLPNDEDHFIILTVVPSYKAVPEVIRLESVYPITLNFILREVSRRYKCSSNQVFLALNNNKVLTRLSHSSTENVEVNNKSDYWAFILPSRKSGSSSGREVMVIVQNRILFPSQSPLLEETAIQRELLGSPIVLPLSSSTTNRELYDTVEKCISRYHQSSKRVELHDCCLKTASHLNADGTRMCSVLKFSKSDDGKYIFELKQAEKHFWKCSKCRWPKMCRGCSIPCNSKRVNLRPTENDCIYIAADWNLAAFINEYQQTQEERKVIDTPDLDAAKAIQLTSLLQNFFKEESVNKCDSILCEECQQRKCFTMSTMIRELPDVLLISIKRFHATGRGWRKSSELVDFPLTALDMRAYLSKEAKCENTLYDLYAVVNHMGKLDEGHYYASIRIEDGRWFRVNDTQYSEVRKESVVTPDAYILFYQRRQSGC
ncbi:ubiquitin carboxyl terminal hydrolase 4 [Echinococcus multilocularis]|uniref:ubiquitinyl hydrolase 1 n=1 Tax=Echinococcus multilocularis TaxID=6211 RepID=A0A068YH29_ECHMU|nr:ubiquitin carboxyl terminal hydrolase 4 [Echinococcus multilocularis]